MEEKNMTALISCFVRAYHTKEYKVKVFEDLLAEKVLGPDDYYKISNNMKNGITFFNPNFKGTDDEALRYIVDNQLSPSVLGRSILSETVLNNSKKFGTKQYLILASGYDTSFYKNKDLKVFEIDTEPMINDKKKRLDEANTEYANVKYITANLIKDEWADLLLKSNFDSNKKTFCSMLGISYYLTKEQFEKTLSKVSSLLSTGSEIVFDYPNNTETKNEKINQELAKGANEEMKSKYSLKDIANMCEKNSLVIHENLNNTDMTDKYFSEYNILNPINLIIAPKGVSYCVLVKK